MWGSHELILSKEIFESLDEIKKYEEKLYKLRSYFNDKQLEASEDIEESIKLYLDIP